MSKNNKLQAKKERDPTIMSILVHRIPWNR